MFQPLALETLGPINTGISFLVELGRRLTNDSGDAWETMYSFQRVSLVVQRYNLVALKGNLYSSYGTGLVPLQRTWF